MRLAACAAVLVACVSRIEPTELAGPARHATAGRGETCDRAAIARDLETARLRGHLGRLGVARFERGGSAIDGGGAIADEAVPILDEDGELVRIAVAGQGVTLLVWIDRADLSPVALAEARVSPEPGAPPPADGLGLTVLPGHPVGEAQGGWVRVRGHGLFAFDGWIPDDAGELWEPVPATRRAAADVWIEAGSRVIDDADGVGRELARVRRGADARLIESNPLGADKIELVDADARLVGYAVRPPPARKLVPPQPAMLTTGTPEDPAVGPPRQACLYSEPGGAVVGVVDGVPIDTRPTELPGWTETPIATPWGEVVVAVAPTVPTGR
jgi:hypothetical protein